MSAVQLRPPAFEMNPEKRARIANLISLLFCFLAVFINYHRIITLFVIGLSVIELIHVFFGDITQSYMLLGRKQFLRIYLASIILFFLLCFTVFFILSLKGKVYISSIFAAFLFDSIANYARFRKIKNRRKK